MEIGTEISRKIRTAIKGKLQELGAYVDEELPDYIMVMVANKKSQEQMTDDLSLFLGSNTSRFTTWLQGVLDKLRSAAPESNSLKASEAIIFESSLPPLPTLPSSREDGRRDAKTAAASSTRHERVSSDIGAAARLMSTVKPLRELSPSEAVIDIKLDVDDPFNDDVACVSENAFQSRKRPTVASTYRNTRPTAQLYRPPGSGQQAYHDTESGSALQRLPPGRLAVGRPAATNTKALYSSRDPARVSETYRSTLHTSSAKVSLEDESARKRKLPVVSSVVKVKRVPFGGEEEEEEEEEYIAHTTGVSSSVSVPARPERRPSLPPSKQANKNLILKAISEAQDSVTKTTSYTTAIAAPQKQTVPVAPRARSEEELILMRSQAAMLYYQTDPQGAPERREQPAAGVETLPTGADIAETMYRRDLFSRLQPDPEEPPLKRQDPREAETLRPVDSRSFILKRTKLSAPPPQSIAAQPAGEIQPQPGRLIQPREASTYEKPASPKFIVTLDGVPSPPGYLSDQEPEEEPMCFTEEGETYPEPYGKLSRAEQSYPTQLLAEPLRDTDVLMETKEKVNERCKYWPACKNADSCAYHHPTAPCKAFPKCRFADKCFFIHPNCKYDAKCTKADCPFTHASRRLPAAPLKPVPGTHPAAQQCRYFPACKKTDCPFYHPKHCRFSTHCTRSDCTFYHPSSSVPPRHALTWIRSQASD